MAYCTIDDLKAAMPESVLIQLTDDEKTGSVNTARVSAAITAAESEINGYCEARYTVPFTTVPTIIKKMTVDITLYNLFARKGASMEGTRGESVQKRYDNAIRFLTSVSKGTVTVGTPEAPSAQTMDVKAPTKEYDDDFKDKY